MVGALRALSTREKYGVQLSGIGRNTATPGRKTLVQLGFPVLQTVLRGVLRPSAARGFCNAFAVPPGGVAAEDACNTWRNTACNTANP